VTKIAVALVDPHRQGLQALARRNPPRIGQATVPTIVVHAPRMTLAVPIVAKIPEDSGPPIKTLPRATMGVPIGP
jgi:hypothetical protein